MEEGSPCRAAATLTSYGLRRLKSALSVQLSQRKVRTKQRLLEMGSVQERQLTKEEMEAREAAGSAATRRCVCRPRLQRARVRFSILPKGVHPLSRRQSIGMGRRPKQAHIHLNLGCTPSGSPRTAKFGPNATVCNRRFTGLMHLGFLLGARLGGWDVRGRRVLS